MKNFTASKFKTQFSNILKLIENGETVAVTFGRKREIVGYFVKDEPSQAKLKLGLLEGKAKFTFSDDFEITEDEFLGLEN